jgi:hypothetical protein
MKTAYNVNADRRAVDVRHVPLKLLLKRGALLAAANWPVIAIQFVAGTTFRVLVAVPVIGAAILVDMLLGGDLAQLLQGSLRDMFTTITSTLMSTPVAPVVVGAFLAAVGVVMVGGSILMFLVKGGTVDVLIAAHRAAGPIEREPLTIDTLKTASGFTLERFTGGCGRLFKSYLAVGLTLMMVYAISGAAYLAFVIYGYRAATDRFLVLGWAFVTAVSAALLVAWITLVNLLYLLTQIAIAVDGGAVTDAPSAVLRFIRARFRDLAAVFAAVVVLVIATTFASALAWSGVGLIAFVPIVGLAVIPLQLTALLIRGLVFEYLGLTALGAYVALYVEYADQRDRASNTDPVWDPASAVPRQAREAVSLSKG